jgi:pyruvate/2-oxoglutarate/acetoin dehydrogenase E1 component
MTTVLDSLNSALHSSLEKDPSVFILGEDILDPYGGAFKITRGLSEKYSDRVLTTPISEAAIVGVATGMALRGLRPVVEIMFGDFVTLVADQLINHAAKFRWMYNNNVQVPIVVRTPMGGRRGYGPTHSQSLEKLFIGVPGLKVIAPSTLGNPGDLLLEAIADEDPILFVEHKILYTCPLLVAGQADLVDYQLERIGSKYSTHILRPLGEPRLTIATYGYNFELVRRAAIDLMMEYEIFSDILVFAQLAPFDMRPLTASVKQTGHLLTVEEGGITLGWGAEVLARMAENSVDVSNLRMRRVAARDLPIGNARNLEDEILPSVQDIMKVALEILS